VRLGRVRLVQPGNGLRRDGEAVKGIQNGQEGSPRETSCEDGVSRRRSGSQQTRREARSVLRSADACAPA